MTSQPDPAPRFADPQQRNSNDFHVEVPPSPLGQSSTTHDSFSGNGGPADDRLKLDEQRTVNMYSAQRTKSGKTPATE